DAEDAAQKVFCELLPILPTLTSHDSLRAWLYRASLLTALNLKRSQKRRMDHERNRRPEGSSALSDSDVEAIHEHVANLRDDLRMLIVRRYFDRQTLGELAQSEGCTAVAVWKRLQNAHEELRRSLSRAGLASVAIAVLAFLESREAVAAPANLLPEKLPRPSSTGATVKVKMAASSVLVALAGTAI